jgi:hypothetical protein
MHFAGYYKDNLGLTRSDLIVDPRFDDGKEAKGAIIPNFHDSTA